MLVGSFGSQPHTQTKTTCTRIYPEKQNTFLAVNKNLIKTGGEIDSTPLYKPWFYDGHA